MSKPSLSLPAEKIGDQLILDRARLARFLKELPEGKYAITVEKHVANRSKKANAYLWGVCYALLSEHTGYTKDELHAWAKAEFLGVQTKTILLQDETGEVKHERQIPLDPTTTTMDTHDFTVFVESIRRVAAELGCVIPDPDPEYMFNEQPRQLKRSA